MGPVPAPDFYLGERDEGSVTDYDGHIRACYLIAWLRTEGERPEQARFPRLTVDPALPLPNGATADQVVITPRYAGDDLSKLSTGQMAGWASWVRDPALIVDGVIRRGALEFFSWANIARHPSALPASQEDHFLRNLRMLQRFVNREGDARIPSNHTEGDAHLSSWVNRMRHAQVRGDLRQDWVTQLESIPEWEWWPGDGFHFLRRYAEQEGHTDVPLEYEEDLFLVGRWVALQRESYSRGWLDRDSEDRLEAIPNWHW